MTFACDVGESITGRAWRWRQGEDRIAFAFAERFSLPDTAARVMAARGISLDAADNFLNPTLRALMPDPAVLSDMEVAASRLAHAIKRQEKVAVFGDYDVDGACSAALMLRFLRGFGVPGLAYVPDRMREGYGPNIPALQNLADQGATLVILTDCGTAAGTVLACLDGRADVIVLDHHKADGPPPRILATINPNRFDDRSGLTHLCSAGIAFMTAVATLRVLRRDGFFTTRKEPDLRDMLDLVALATVCDVMQLTGLNRVFVAQGLKIMARRGRAGIAALLDQANASGVPSAMSCGFILGPRINAGGRIAQADLGLRLLLEDDPVEARALAQTLDAVNRERQAVESGVLESALHAAEVQILAGHAVILVAGPYHPGIVGIAAGRLKEKFNRPVCVGGEADGRIKGSGRSIAGIDLGAAIISARHAGILNTGGGHAMAAGFGLSTPRLADFHDFLDTHLAAAREAPAKPDLAIDASVSAAGADLALAHGLNRLAPFGAGNEEPCLAVANCRIARTDRLGAEGNTLRVFAEGPNGARLKALLFRANGSPIAELLERRSLPLVHLAGNLRAEAWQGRENVTLFLTDAALA
jgi:single-stranded-DNA-specific exonuclease